MFKKSLILLCAFCVGIFSTQVVYGKKPPRKIVPGQEENVKEATKSYLKDYGAFAQNLYNFGAGTRLKIGVHSDIENNLSILHLYEMGELIANGDLDACCWRYPGARYSTYAYGTTQQVIDGATVPNPGVPGGQFKIPDNYGAQMDSALGQLRQTARELDPSQIVPSGGDVYDEVTFKLMQDIAVGATQPGHIPPGTFLASLDWGFSYLSQAYVSANFPTTFTHYYSWTCIACLGGGLYDTNGLFQTNPDTGQLYYYDVITAAKLPNTYTWLQSLPKPAGYPEVPPQISIGLTMQGQTADQPGGQRVPGPTYGTHCHKGEELYVPLDAMSLTKKIGSTILQGQPGYTYSTDTLWLESPMHLDFYHPLATSRLCRNRRQL